MTRPEEHDYLWDGSGPADPDVARLERALGGLRHTGSPPELPARAPKPTPRRAWLAIPAAAHALAAALIRDLALRPGAATATACAGAAG